MRRREESTRPLSLWSCRASISSMSASVVGTLLPPLRLHVLMLALEDVGFDSLDDREEEVEVGNPEPVGVDRGVRDGHQVVAPRPKGIIRRQQLALPFVQGGLLGENPPGLLGVYPAEGRLLVAVGAAPGDEGSDFPKSLLAASIR